METSWREKCRRVYGGGSVLDTKIDVHSVYSSIPTNIFGAIVATLGIPNDLSILDVGCGRGGFLLYLESLGHRGHLSGVDLADNISSQVKTRKDIQFSAADIEALPFISDTFDAVTAIHMLSHVQNLAHGMMEIQRVLTRDGRFVASANSLQSYPHVAKYRKMVFQEFDWGEPLFSTTRFNLENMKEILNGYWKQVNLVILTGELRIPVKPFLRYFAAHIDVWEKIPTLNQRDEILRLVAEWSAQDAIDGYIVELKRVGITTCANH
ncbi:MAG: class I SAM-dependent methyltransferase [bacterium]|nr:class I SAM-dependent methyltransferase [bacterium]